MKMIDDAKAREATTGVDGAAPTTSTIVLKEREGDVEIHPANVFFSFPDGGLGYDCITCGSKCCRGHGYSLERDHELLVQVSRRPHLRFFVSSMRGDSGQASVTNLPPSCYFLKEDGRCQIHEEEGYDLKPETCRLFPFNDMFLLGRTLVVRPHESLCPLSILPPTQRSAVSGYDSLLESMMTRPLVRAIPTARSIVRDADALLSLEKEIAAASAASLRRDGSFPEFVDEQADLANQSRICPHDFFPGDAETQLKRSAQLLAIDFADLRTPRADVNRVLLGMTSYLRSTLVFSPKKPDGRFPEPYSLGLEGVHRALLATYVILQLASLAGATAINWQTVTRIVKSHRNMILLLANLTRKVGLRRGVLIPIVLSSSDSDLQLPFIHVVRDLLAKRKSARQQCLGDIIERYQIERDEDRLRFARLLGGRIATDLRENAVSFGDDTSLPSRIKARALGIGIRFAPRLVADACTLTSGHTRSLFRQHANSATEERLKRGQTQA